MDALTLIGMFFLGVGATVTVYAVRDFNRRIRQLEADKDKLAEFKGKRIPYEIAEYLENAMAAADAAEEEYKHGLAIIGNEKAWIARARNYGLKNKEEK